MPEYRGDVSQVAGAATVAANHEDPNNTSIFKQIFSMLSPTQLPKYLAEDLLALSGAPAGKAGRDKHDPIRHDPIRLAHLT